MLENYKLFVILQNIALNLLIQIERAKIKKA